MGDGYRAFRRCSITRAGLRPASSAFPTSTRSCASTRSRIALATPWQFLKHKLTCKRAVLIFFRRHARSAGPGRQPSGPAPRHSGHEAGRLQDARQHLDRRRTTRRACAQKRKAHARAAASAAPVSQGDSDDGALAIRVSPAGRHGKRCPFGPQHSADTLAAGPEDSAISC